MILHAMKNRASIPALAARSRSDLQRIVVLTGARQTGKTTLAGIALPAWPYVSVDDPAVRPTFSRMTAQEWIARMPRAVVDEVQKVPSLVDSIKAAHDGSPGARYLLLGSSQVLLLSQVRESLAGRATLLELWPLTLPELVTTGWDDPVRESRLIRWLKEGAADPEPLLGIPSASPSFARDVAAWRHYASFGGMPALSESGIAEEDRHRWLLDYRRTYLERDVRDLASVRDLEPFVRAQALVAARTGSLLNLSDLARGASVSPNTAARFVRYLEISYQVILLPSWHGNREKRLTKMPKVHFVDPGVQRACLLRRGELTGQEFESAVVSEIHKQIRNAGMAATLHHLRTHDGREVDLLIETEHGFVGIEVKQTEHVAPADGRGLRGLESILDKPLLAGIVLSQDRDARLLEPGILAVPVPWALGSD